MSAACQTGAQHCRAARAALQWRTFHPEGMDLNLETHAMNKATLVAAACAACAGGAMAQSVTLYGRIDLNLGRQLGADQLSMTDPSGSRLGVRVSEYLGGGLSTVAALEHRFDPDTGESQSPFWKGQAFVGLKGGFGQVLLGRQYNVAFSIVQNQIDPFGGDTVGETRANLILGTGKIRVNDAVVYRLTGGGLDIGASLGVEKGSDAAGDKADRPLALAASYTAGPLWLGLGWENPGDGDDRLMTAGVRYDVGVAVLSAGFSQGRNAADARVRGLVLGADIPLGSGNLYAAYGRSRVGDATTSSKFGLGYRYPLSRRTRLYADIGRDGKRYDRHETGFDLGLIHAF